jgi:hypothetical protein
MQSPVLVAGVAAAGYAALYTFAHRAGVAVSPEAHSVETHVRQITTDAERSLALFGRKSTLLADLHAACKSSSAPDWDSYGAEPANLAAVDTAAVILRHLPDSLPLPDVSIEPDGSVALDWLPNSVRAFSVSVGPSDRVAYAWFAGTDRGHGVTRVVDGSLPAELIRHIRSVVYDEPTLWAA